MQCTRFWNRAIIIHLTFVNFYHITKLPLFPLLHNPFLLSQMLQRQQDFQEQQQSTTETETTKEFQQPGVNPDAMEILHVKRKKTIHTAFKQAKTTKSITSQSVASHSTTSQSITNQSTKKQSIMGQSHADESTARQMSENRAITDQAAAKSGTM